jgi:hypothetical protein
MAPEEDVRIAIALEIDPRGTPSPSDLSDPHIGRHVDEAITGVVLAHVRRGVVGDGGARGGASPGHGKRKEGEKGSPQAWRDQLRLPSGPFGWPGSITRADVLTTIP